MGTRAPGMRGASLRYLDRSPPRCRGGRERGSPLCMDDDGRPATRSRSVSCPPAGRVRGHDTTKRAGTGSARAARPRHP